MKNIFELSDAPTTENTSSIIKDGLKIKTSKFTQKSIKSSVLKIMLDGIPFYHFQNKEFDNELASRQQDVVIEGKRFYVGLKNNSMHAKYKLTSNI